MTSEQVDPDQVWPAVVVGAGAAGMLAAIFAGRSGVRTLLLETRPQPGAKIRVSGGGRCNLLPSQLEADDFHTHGSAHAMRNVLLSWPLEEVRAFFEGELGIPLKVEPTGKVFPVSDDPREVVAALLAECARAGVELAGGFRVASARRAEGEPFRFELADDTGRTVRAERVALATGGLSLPKTGSDGGGLELARALGHELVPTHPALVPLLTADPAWRELAGISLPVRLTVLREERALESRCGDFLFTHAGFSGPVVLDLSHHFAGAAGARCSLHAQWGGDGAPDWERLLREGGKQRVESILREALPRRLAGVLLARAGIAAEQKASEFPREARKRLLEQLAACPLAIRGDEGYRTAEVTDGGIALAELKTRTLESRVVPGLFFAGEMIDVTGRIGGYNFLWAFVSGRKVGRALGESA
jgi:predicted Rossmann fold flavoprotein